jgi:hypothetical protein
MASLRFRMGKRSSHAAHVKSQEKIKCWGRAVFSRLTWALMGDDSSAYEVTDDELRGNNKNFSKFNPEEQAVVVERYWTRKFNETPSAGANS